MGVTATFALSKVGWIPPDWTSVQIGEVAETSSGTTPPRALAARYYCDVGFAWVKTLDLNNSKIDETSERVTQAALDETSLRIYPVGSVLVAMYGGFNQIGRTGILCIPAAVNQAITAVRVDRARVVPEFLLRVLNFRVAHWKTVASSSRKDPNISAQDIRNFVLALPQLQEQAAIAEALSDADALIESLEQLLAKKRQVKQGVMQELLTGKTRLPGFRGTWSSTTYGDAFDFLRTANNARSDLVIDGEAYYVHYGDIHTTFHHHLDLRRQRLPMIDRSRCASAAPVCNGDWIVADASEDYDGVAKAVEVVGLAQTESMVAGLHTILLREKRPTFVPGFKGHLGRADSIRQQVRKLATGLKVYGISKTALRQVSLPVPPCDEQEAIAAVLSLMDQDLLATEERIAKARLIKQGMMQELLTGRIRLV